MSKLSQLKQDAYQAGKKRDWRTAVSIYEQILEVDKSNPSLVNELGDLCLKTGDIRSAVRHFINAAAKYRTNGLLNNAVAIYKKVLRHDAENLNAHWYLAETRASQGLLVEGEIHGVQFLENSAHVSGDIKEIFLKRCVSLFELYSTSKPIMEHLLQIFRMWEMQLEAARVSCILGCQTWDSGEEDQAREFMKNISSQTPDIVKYPEHSQWLQRIDPSSPGSAAGFSDVNALDLGGFSDKPEPVEDSVPEETPLDNSVEPVVEQAAEPAAEPVAQQPENISFAPDPVIDEEPSADGFEIEDNLPAVENEISIDEVPSFQEPEQDDEGCFSLDDDTQVSFDELISNAASEVSKSSEEAVPEIVDPLADSTEELPQNQAKDNSDDGEVDLLAQILADDSQSYTPADSDQVATITEEIGAKVGAGGEGDDSSLYEMGLVYLEMDMHDQACDSFEKAACHPEYAVRAHEMWGITLLRSGRIDEAVIILTAGLDLPEEGSRQQLGMLYHLGRAQEQADRLEEAENCYNKIFELDHSFLDVRQRLAKLTKV